MSMGGMDPRRLQMNLGETAENAREFVDRIEARYRGDPIFEEIKAELIDKDGVAFPSKEGCYKCNGSGVLVFGEKIDIVRCPDCGAKDGARALKDDIESFHDTQHRVRSRNKVIDAINKLAGDMVMGCWEGWDATIEMNRPVVEVKPVDGWRECEPGDEVTVTIKLIAPD